MQGETTAMENMKNTLINWNQRTNERQKLQQIYIGIIVVTIIVAGITALINPDAGHNLVLVAIAAIVIFVANAVVWNLLKAAVISNLPTRPRNASASTSRSNSRSVSTRKK